MKISNFKKLVQVSLLLAMSVPAHAANFEIQSALFGYMRGVYGNGSRYGAQDGYDRIGLSQFAVGVEAKVDQGYRFVGLFAADVLSDGTGDGANVGIKDTFIDVESIANSNFGLSLGAQPFMFGLKANGYPGDHSIQPSIEFMKIFGSSTSGTLLNDRSFAVSQQAGPSAKLTYNMGKDNRVVVGAFDTNEFSPTTKRGSAVHDNVFAYFKSDRFLVDNLRVFAGGMTRFLGQSVDKTADFGASYAMWDIGAAYRMGRVDLSVEGIVLDKHFSGTKDAETLIVAETQVHITDRNSVYVDYGSAQEIEVQTLRAGFVHNVNAALLAQVEYSEDNFEKGTGFTAGKSYKANSFDVMLKYSF